MYSAQVRSGEKHRFTFNAWNFPRVDVAIDQSKSYITERGNTSSRSVTNSRQTEWGEIMAAATRRSRKEQEINASSTVTPNSGSINTNWHYQMQTTRTSDMLSPRDVFKWRTGLRRNKTGKKNEKKSRDADKFRTDVCGSSIASQFLFYFADAFIARCL